MAQDAQSRLLQRYARGLSIAGPGLVLATAVVDNRWTAQPVSLLIVLISVGLLRLAAKERS